ncbi:non-heme iron oxygenase ferredoxin subunit [Pseudomonas fluorescens]|uniref:Rieske 2Fe-2S domain-containing protein n=2 Tax=Pseudomonas TaxID=286 RepID=UPI000CF32FE3|nr:non-heme iron oxygenase ferredoxin subunit [Pseudomonas fluorescens]MBD8257401.1 non-heme iron oxygenase ferredoxin subunit [Pseudomonas fluorescens]NJJ55142.1 non-heme iron oxygenase ferredoxin subunit [Pseudomonas sp. B14(2022)]
MRIKASNLIALCASADVPEDEGLRVELQGMPTIAVYRVNDEYYATDDLCSHGEASLAEGMLKGFEILCPFHLGGFDIRTGKATTAPCYTDIRAYKVLEQEGNLYILQES